MGLKRCLLACLLALSGVGTAAAMDSATRDPITAHITLDVGSRDGSNSGNEASAANRDCTQPTSGDTSSDDSDGGGSSGALPHSRASHRNGLSWQSLLPGSIQ